MARRVADVLQVVVLATRADTALRGGRPHVRPSVGAEEDVLELDHARVGEQQGGIVAGHERAARHDLVPAAAKVLQEGPSKLVAVHESSARESVASPPRRRPERRSYLFRGESAPLQKAGLADPFVVVGGCRVAEAPGTRLLRAIRPVRVVLSDRLPRRRIPDSALAELLANACGAVTATAARADELLGEPFLAQQPPCFECIEHTLNRVRSVAARGELGCELAAGMLPAREQPESPRSKFRIPLGGQASTASAASSPTGLLEGRSRSRNAVSIAPAISSCSLRKSRTLSRPWPMRSPR